MSSATCAAPCTVVAIWFSHQMVAPSSGEPTAHHASVLSRTHGSPVGNRVSCFDLVNNRSQTFPFENRNNVVRAVLSPAGNIMLLIDEEGRALLVSTRRQVVLHHHRYEPPPAQPRPPPES